MEKFRIYYTVVRAAYIDVNSNNLDEAIDLAEKHEHKLYDTDKEVLDFDPYTYDFNTVMKFDETTQDFEFKETE